MYPFKSVKKGQKKECELCGKQDIIVENVIFLQETINLKFNNNKFTRKSEKKVSSTLTENMASIQSNSSFVTKQIARQLNQPRAQPQIPLRSSAFILEEINEHSRKGTRPYLIQRMGKQYVPLSSLQEALSQTSKRVGN
ncbi:hypothetical protein KY285_030355 [Solanum tuberosum]|nr:hypothetical protein KY285_030355 [Solanum tuberosum]